MSFFKKLFKGIGSALGIYQDNSAQKAAIKQQEKAAAQLAEQQKQALILQNSNETSQVTQFEEGGGQDADSFLGIAGTKRKKQATGGATSSLGLQY